MWIIPPSPDCHSVPASADSTLESKPDSPTLDSGIAFWVTRSGMATRLPRSWRGWLTRAWSERLFGAMTSPVWTPNLCGDVLGYSTPDFLASHFPSQANNADTKTSATSGQKSSASSAKSSLAWSSSKTSPVSFQRQLFITAQTSLPTSLNSTLPSNLKRALKSAGTVEVTASDFTDDSYESKVCRRCCSLKPVWSQLVTQWKTQSLSLRSRLERATAASECSSSPINWHTPHGLSGDHGPDGGECSTQARNWATPGVHSSPDASPNSTRQSDLREQIKNWPAPRAEDSESCGNHPAATDSLTGATKMWATPAAHERTQTSRQVDHGIQLANQVDLWPTPNAMGGGSTSRGGDRIGEPLLAGQAQNWSTPAASDGKRGTSPYSQTEIDRPGGKPMVLSKDVATWPTPNSRDHKGSDMDSRSGGASLSHFVQTGERCHSLLPDPEPTGAESPNGSGQPSTKKRLNQYFVEWLMSLPVGWTIPGPIDSGVSAMVVFRRSLQRLLSTFFEE